MDEIRSKIEENQKIHLNNDSSLSLFERSIEEMNQNQDDEDLKSMIDQISKSEDDIKSAITIKTEEIIKLEKEIEGKEHMTKEQRIKIEEMNIVQEKMKEEKRYLEKKVEEIEEKKEEAKKHVEINQKKHFKLKEKITNLTQRRAWKNKERS